MDRKYRTSVLRGPALAVLFALMAGCGGDGGGGLSNKNPGANDVGVVVAFGDSITMGNRCACAPYPARLSGWIGKVVVNAGINGTMAREGLGRIQSVIVGNRPGFMLILYGINDVIHGQGTGGTAGALRQMVEICRQNNVVPVLATYPIPFGSHGVFAGGTRGLNFAIRSLASEMRVPCVDLEAEFGGAPGPDGAIVPANRALMEADGLHPNDAGTQVMAWAFADLF